MPKYYCPYCPDLISCIHDNKYLVDESEFEFEILNTKPSIKRRNSDDNKSLLDESEPMIITDSEPIIVSSELLNIKSSTKRININNHNLISDSEPILIKSSTKRRNSDDNPNILIENSIKDITNRLKKIKVTKKISYKRKPDEIIYTKCNKKIKVIS
jgi:hypothetical protein